jgi:5-hmdU DNA kinase, helical domain
MHLAEPARSGEATAPSFAVQVGGRVLQPTPVFDTYWRFAAERQAIYLARLRRSPFPWTNDDVLRSHRFTNVFRAADRVSQFLITEVQRGPRSSQEPADMVFRTLLFKIFNREDTWQHLEASVGPVMWRSYDYKQYRAALDEALARGPIYSAAYVMPPPRLGEDRKHANHLRLLEQMMCDGIADTIRSAPSLEWIYKTLVSYAGLGPFLAFQYTIDLNYSDLVRFEENDFVVAGPGARDGIRKCFGREASGIEADVIRYMVDTQDKHFQRLGLDFPGLFGRCLHLIDAQNLFCEVDKYARVRHPEVAGISGRSKIKQKYTPGATLAAPAFPKRWRLESNVAPVVSGVDDGDGARVEVDPDGAAAVVAQVTPRRVAGEDCPLPF